jgi:hypothetical protein
LNFDGVDGIPMLRIDARVIKLIEGDLEIGDDERKAKQNHFIG